ncbi:FAS1 domain-containing protein [Bisporella sp. PMI_857]|nr:FAS1 domain-containing protein [Bisporella sp. PMI_857]
MQLKNLLPVAFVALASAQSSPGLTDALAAQNATLSSLTSLLGANPALVETLSRLSNITILAPSNDAIAAFLNSSAGQAVATDAGAVTALLTYHVLNGSFPASAFTNSSQSVPTLLTNTSFTNVTGGQVVEATLNGTNVTITSGLLSKSQVVVGDVAFSGGVIHVINTVLTVPQSPSGTALAAGLTALVGAAEKVGLVSTVDSLKDVTIFAPSNEAFSAAGSAFANATNEKLTSVLSYHVIQGTVGYSSILTNSTLKTVQGGDVTISILNGSVYVNSAKVIIPNVLVSNGVVHVIDGVLNPENTSAAPNPSTTEVAFPGATSVSNNPLTSVTGTPSATISSSVIQAATSSSTAGAARALETGVIGLGALFGAAAIVMA